MAKHAEIVQEMKTTIKDIKKWWCRKTLVVLDWGKEPVEQLEDTAKIYNTVERKEKEKVDNDKTSIQELS